MIYNLQTVSVKVVRRKEYTLAMGPHNDTLCLGGWNLPFIQHIDLSANKSGCTTSLGAFDQCPLLTYLRIYCTGTSNITDPSQITDMQRARAPVWHLPKLKTLCLYETIALHFNYDSLLNMPNLEILLVGTWVNCDEAAVAPLLPSHIWDASELQVGTADNNHDISSNNVHDHNSESACLTDEPESRAWPDDWELPKLRKVELLGFPSNVFGFDWVHHCPKLECVSFKRTAETNRRLSLRKSTNGRHIPSESEAGHMFESTQQGHDMPLYNNPLKSLYLKGPWVISDSDLCELLTDYAPNLETLHAERLYTGLRKDGSGFFQAIHDPPTRSTSLGTGRVSSLISVQTTCSRDRRGSGWAWCRWICLSKGITKKHEFAAQYS